MQLKPKEQSSELSQERSKLICHLYALAWDANLTIGRFLYVNKTPEILGDFNLRMREHLEAFHVLIGRNRILLLSDWVPIIETFENHILSAFEYSKQALNDYELFAKIPAVADEKLEKIENEFSSTLDGCLSIFTNFLEASDGGVFINPTHHLDGPMEVQNPFSKISRMNSSPEIDEGIHSLASILKRMSNLVAGMVYVMIEHELASKLRTETLQIPSDISHAIVPLCTAIANSTNTLLELSDGPGLQTRDCYSISRCIVELGVNVCYIMANGSEMAKKAYRHAQQRMFRELEKESRIGTGKVKVSVPGRPEIEDIPGMREAIDEFSTARGKAKDWTDKNLEQRIESVGERFGHNIQGDLDFASFIVYRQASEVLRGSLYSTLHFFAISGGSKPDGKNASAKWVASQHELILISAIMANAACIESFHKLYGFESADNRCKALFKELKQVLASKRAKKE
jgi:hypothetical protein